MKRPSFFRKILSVVFAAVIVFTVTVREVHYIFWEHDKHEQCENHLHAGEHHEDCSVCKFDISIFTDEVAVVITSSNSFSNTAEDCFYTSPATYSQVSSAVLRGPPFFG